MLLCHIVPSLVKLRKEGLDGHEKIKSCTWWISLGFAILEATIGSSYSLPYSIYAASYRVKNVMVTALLLVCGAMTMTWICSAVSWWPYMFVVLGVFTVVTMWAVIVTEGCRKIKLQYYEFKLASAAREDSPITEVEPYIPFNINPSGMQPLLTATYLLAFPSIVASILGSPFWEHVKEILNPTTFVGAEPWANMRREIADYLNKMGARIPNIKPGKATIEYLSRVQASTRFWGGLLLSILATTSTILDHYLRRINEGFAIGFTSILIIVGSIIELRRSYQAYNVMPSLSKALRLTTFNKITLINFVLDSWRVRLMAIDKQFDRVKATPIAEIFCVLDKAVYLRFASSAFVTAANRKTNIPVTLISKSCVHDCVIQ
ncbi:preprotein translocase subunit SCY2, chloroplastic-like [Hibiscus syriacus]|uniref:preprotein translocase subunit SCY2, chloroplastic-like n=1 Tax=Hibiscus syriacus TaxID=106335 RepID=UPI001924671B|nr:preprotein translocase subunit SCY2, chloroplastic-like [Hibiscus syriacus]